MARAYDQPIGEVEDLSEEITPENKLFNMIIYGDPGVGKTQLAASVCEAPELSPALLINHDQGQYVLDKNALGWPQIPRNWPVNGDPDRVEQAYWYLLLNNKRGYKTVIMDTGTEYQQNFIDSKVMSGTEIGKRADAYDRQLKDYGTADTYMKLWMRRFRDLPLNFILICHAAEYDMPDGSTTLGPMFTKKLWRPICAMFDVVMYLTTKDVDGEPGADGETPVISERRILTQRGQLDGVTITAKDRSTWGSLGRTMRNPNMKRIYAKLNAPKPREPRPRKEAPVDAKKV